MPSLFARVLYQLRRIRARGFVFASTIKPGVMAAPKRGIRIRNETRGPPWIVVANELSTLIPTPWPGSVWRVEVIDAVTLNDLREFHRTTIRPDAGYTRAIAVNILAEEPIANLFGAHGAAVCAMIEIARELDEERTTRLSAARHSDAAQAYSRTWRKWLTDHHPTDPHRDDNLDGTLQAGARRPLSPVGYGLTVIHDQVSKRAQHLCGNAAFRTDEDGDAWLVEPWLGASATLLDAALAFGAPDIVEDSDREILTRAWLEVIGPAAQH